MCLWKVGKTMLAARQSAWCVALDETPGKEAWFLTLQTTILLNMNNYNYNCKYFSTYHIGSTEDFLKTKRRDAVTENHLHSCSTNSSLGLKNIM